MWIHFEYEDRDLQEAGLVACDVVGLMMEAAERGDVMTEAAERGDDR